MRVPGFSSGDVYRRLCRDGGEGGGRLLVGSLLLAALLGALLACSRKPPSPQTPPPETQGVQTHPGEATPAEAARAVIPPPPQRPVPAELRAAHEEIRAHQKAGRFQDAVALSPPFLGALEKAWGAESPDLAPYAYDYALALKLAGRSGEALAVVTRTLGRWSESFQLRVLEATIRVEASVARGGFDPAADAALRTVLAPESLPRLRGLRVEPASLFGQWADMLLRGGRVEDALSVVERSLAISPKDFHAWELKARALLYRKQPLDALPILRGLAAERPSPIASLHLAGALLDAGDPAGAWDLFAKILAEPRGFAGRSAMSDTLLAVRGARALNQLRRHAEAAELLVGDLLDDPDHVEALTELAAAARGLKAAEAAKGLEGRVRRLQQRERLKQAAAGARAAGLPSSVPFYRAQAVLEVGRAGEALSLLEDAVRLAPRIARFHLDLARVRLLLGRRDLAEKRLIEGLRQGPSAILAAELARVSVLRGVPGDAKALLGAPEPEDDGASEKTREDAASGGPETGDRALARGLRARALLELGDREGAEAALRGEADPGEANDVVLLARAELAILGGRAGEAREILEGSFDNVPGGHLPGSPSWAAALRAILPPEDVPAREEGDDGDAALPADPSDLLDHPRLLGPEYPWPRRGPAGAARPVERWLESLRSALARREEILSKMEGFGDSDVVSRWREFLALYREIGAERKAREVAWYIVLLRPESIDDRRALLETLDRPGEALLRLRILDAALGLAPRDEGLLEMRRASRTLLGLDGGAK